MTLAACAPGDDDAYTGDPKCFAQDAQDATCTSSEGVVYRVVDRDSTGALGARSFRLDRGPSPAGPATVAVTVQITPGTPYDGDVSLQKARGRLFVPASQTQRGDRVTYTWKLPENVAGELDAYPAYVTFFQEPADCPGAKAQCFVYIRLWK